MVADSLWCPQCGCEYRPGFTECADCHVALVTTEPDVVDGRPDSDADDRDNHEEPVVYDVADLSSAERDKLELLLRGAGIPVVWSDETALCVPQDREGDVDAFLADLEAAPLPAPPARPEGAGESPGADPGTHRCDAPGCRFALELTRVGDSELAVSWTEQRDGEFECVTLADVLRSHGGQTPSIVHEHAATLVDAARQAERFTTALRHPDADDDLGAEVTLENLADFAAELSSWCLGRPTEVDDALLWTAATAVMRAVVAMSALTDLIDSGSDAPDG